MNILITHVFSSKNKGDAAILLAIQESFRRAKPDVDLEVVTTETQAYPDEKTFYSFFYLGFYKPGGLFWKFARSSYVLMSSLFWAWIYGKFGTELNFLLTKELRKTLNAYLRTNAIVPVGGGYITGKNNLHGTLTIIFRLHAILVAQLLKKPIFLYSQSIGPFGNNFQKKLTKWVLSKVTKIYLREDFSLKTLEEIGINKELIVRTPDAAFTFKSAEKSAMRNLLTSRGVDFNKKILGITLKHFLSGEQHETYIQAIASFISHIQNTGQYSIILVPQVTSAEHNDDDRVVSRDVLNKLESRGGIVFMEDELSHTQLKGIYENLDFLVGTRMHSCIFSLTGLVPVLPIQYEYKTGGIMKDLGLYEWVMPIAEVRGELLKEKFSALVSKKDDYLNQLKSKLPGYILDSEQPAFEIVEYLKKTKLS